MLRSTTLAGRSAFKRLSWPSTSDQGRTIEFHRGQIRGALGFRECSVSDADKLDDRHPRRWRAAAGSRHGGV
jgi:hypothetical protein